MRSRIIILITMAGLILGACAGASDTAVPPSPIPADTSVPTPELTSTPTVPLAVLILPAEMDAETSNLYQETVYELTQAAGMRFQVRNSFSPADIEPGLKIVIAFPPDPGLAEIAAAAPDVQFLAMNIPGITAGENVSVLGDNSQSAIAAFLAGYTAAMLTDDYRTGMLMPKDNNDAIQSFNAFTNGRKYFCGLCQPNFFYNWEYPQFLEIGADQEESAYGAFADILILQYKVGTIFIHPDIHTQDLVDYIGTTGTYMIGTTSPERIPAGWIMTIQPDTIQAIQAAWGSLMAGDGGLTVQSPLGLSDVDPILLSPGKQQDVQEVLDKLQQGLIAP
ncbi:MAG TPA: hypothetical protein VK851_05415 [Anaerolineales bacterium]|nr:hypothetical protein [Anaerolineales bacterium]